MNSSICTTCRQNIEPVKLLLHKARCERFKYYCDFCCGPVLWVEKEEHEAEFHELQ